MWEDEKNRLGGRWLINLNKNARSSELDKMWLEIVGILCFFLNFFSMLWWGKSPWSIVKPPTKGTEYC